MRSNVIAMATAGLLLMAAGAGNAGMETFRECVGCTTVGCNSGQHLATSLVADADKSGPHECWGGPSDCSGHPGCGVSEEELATLDINVAEGNRSAVAQRVEQNSMMRYLPSHDAVEVFDCDGALVAHLAFPQEAAR